DGIRDRNVTGVQTCALPIFSFSVVTNCLKQTEYGKSPFSLKLLMISFDCFSTSSNVSFPYRCWLPTTNQNSFLSNFSISSLPLYTDFIFTSNNYHCSFFT